MLDSSLFSTNFFHYYYENYSFDNCRTRHLGHVFTPINELTALNDSGQFKRSFREIYAC